MVPPALTTRSPRAPANGMAEAFVKTFKRDYVAFGDLSSAARVLEQLPGWFEDYNEHAPHKAASNEITTGVSKKLSTCLTGDVRF